MVPVVFVDDACKVCKVYAPVKLAEAKVAITCGAETQSTLLAYVKVIVPIAPALKEIDAE